MVNRFKKFFLAMTFMFIAAVGFGQAKDTVYSNNICVYIGPTHASDVETKTEIIFDSVKVFLHNLQNDSTSVVEIKSLVYYGRFDDGDEIKRYNAVVNGADVWFGILRSQEGVVKAVAISMPEGGYVFLIVPKELVLSTNKNL